MIEFTLAVVVSWYSFCHGVCTEVLEHPSLVGGRGNILAIDVSKCGSVLLETKKF
jgi:hypothetical protein